MWVRFSDATDGKQVVHFIVLGRTDGPADGQTNATIYSDTLSGGRLNKKDGLTRYGDSHVKNQTS